MVVFGKGFLASVGMGIVLFFAKRLLVDIMARGRLYNAGLTLLLLFSGVAFYIALNLVMKNRDVNQVVKVFLKCINLS